MGTITKTKTWADNEGVNYTDINANFDTIYNEINGNLDSANVDGTSLATRTYVDTPKRALYVPAHGMFTATTSGAQLSNVETTTYKVNYKSYDFDTGTDEYVHFGIASPLNWNAGTITAKFFWTAASGSGTVCWAIEGMSFANDDALDQAYGTVQTTTDTLITAGDVHITSATSALTVGGSPTAGDWLQFRIYRDVSADNLGVDARLLGVRIEFTLDAHSDA
jgi:hypothetical protein